MTPYYKLPSNWTQNRFFLIIGPEGLVSLDLCKQIKNAYKSHSTSYLSIYDKEDIEQLKIILSNALIPNPEVLLIRINPSLLSSFPFELQSNEKIIILYGIEKPIKQKTSAFIIRTYNLKEPFKSKAIQKLLQSQGLKLSAKGIQWLSLCHQNLESQIPNTIEKIKLTYNKSEITDAELKPLLYNHNNHPAYEIIDYLSSNKTALQLFMSSQRPEDWQAIYWTLLGTWRKLILCQYDNTLIKTHFPWDIQKKQALSILNRLNNTTLASQLNSLLDLEKDIKGLRGEPFVAKFQHWLLAAHQAIN